jgi:hypothetical protein
LRPIQTAEYRVTADGHGLKWLLNEARLRDFHRLRAENLGQSGGIAREVKAAVSTLRELAQKTGIPIGLKPQRHDACRDLR